MAFERTLIRVIDLETTGFPPDAAVIEIGACDVRCRPFRLPEVAVFGSNLVATDRPVPPEASAVHHIVAEDLAGAPPWEAVRGLYLDVIDFDYPFDMNLFAAHSAKFERAFLTDEVTGGRPWICTWKCALRLWPDAPSHSNQVLRYWLKPAGIKRDLAFFAHRALPDAYVTAHLLALMLEEASVEQLIAWTQEPALLARIPFGDFRGQPWSACDSGFLHWVLRRDFDEDVKFSARSELQRREALEPEPADPAGAG